LILILFEFLLSSLQDVAVLMLINGRKILKKMASANLTSVLSGIIFFFWSPAARGVSYGPNSISCL